MDSRINLRINNKLWLNWLSSQNYNVKWNLVLQKWAGMNDEQIFKDIKAKCWYDKELNDYESTIDSSDIFEHYNRILSEYDLKNKHILILDIKENKNISEEFIKDIELKIKVLKKILSFMNVKYTISNTLNIKYDYIIPSGSYCYDEKILKKIDKKKIIIDDPLSIVSNKDDEIVKRTILTAQNWLKYDDKTIYDYNFIRMK